MIGRDRPSGASVTAPVRRGTAEDKVEPLRAIGVTPVEVDFASVDDLARACDGSACVVSALSGLHPTIVAAQGVLLDGAVRAGVPRFIPSDFSIDFTGLAPGSNRNFDLRREFHAKLELAPIAATSIYNGAFADMLTGQMPLILYPLKRVLYWEDPDVTMDFTTMHDTAAFTALAALDPDTPRALHVAGDRVSARTLAAIVGEVTGQPFRLLRGGGLGRLETITKIARALFPAKGKVFPPWQGMQYMHNMFEGISPPLTNDRYPGIRWTPVREVLAARGAG